MPDATYSVGEFVFAKLKGYPQWPAIIITPDFASREVLAYRKSDSQKLVRFFRQDNRPGELQWFSDHELEDFQTQLEKMKSATRGKTGATYTHLRQSIENTEKYFQNKDLISADGTVVQGTLDKDSSEEIPTPAGESDKKESNAEKSPANADDAASDTSTDAKLPAPPSAHFTKPRSSLRDPSPAPVSLLSRMTTRRSVAKETEKLATDKVEATTTTPSSSRKRSNGEISSDSGKKKVTPAILTKTASQTPTQNKTTPNGNSSIKTPNSSQSSVATSSQSNSTQSINGVNGISPHKSGEVSMDIVLNDTVKEPVSDAAEGNESQKNRVASPRKVEPVPIEPESENDSELVSHLDYLGSSNAPTCDNIRAIADKFRQEEGELKQLLSDSFFNARHREKQNVVFSSETHFELPPDSVVADGKKVAFTQKQSSPTRTLKLLAGPREIPLPVWFDVQTKLAAEFSRSEPKTQHDDKFALHWNMEIDHKFTYSQSWLSSSDQEMITYSLKSIRVHFDVPDVKAVGKYEVQDASKEIPGRNIKVTLGGVTYLKAEHPLNTFRKAILLVEYQFHWRNFLSLQIRSIQPVLFQSPGLNKVEKEMVEDRIFHMRHAESRRKYGGVTLLSKDNTAYGADAYVILDKLNLDASMKRLVLKYPSWLVEAFLVTVYDGLWLKVGHLDDLMDIFAFASEYNFKDLQTVAEMVLLERLVRTAVFPAQLFSDSILASPKVLLFLTAAFEEMTTATMSSAPLWLELLHKRPEINQMRLDAVFKANQGTTLPEWTLEVKLAKKEKVKVAIGSKDTVGNLKSKIEGLVGLERKKMAIVFDSTSVRTVFADSDKLADIGVVNNITVLVVNNQNS